LGVVVGICILADVLLIGAGTVGIGAIVLLAPWALEVLRWLGVAYLLWFAWTSLRSARTASGLEADTHQRSLKTIVLTTLALTFLRPGVYLAPAGMLGNLAPQQGHGGAGPFPIGAMLGSATWFPGSGYGARGLSRYLARPRVWQVLDVIIAIVLVILAVRLALAQTGPPEARARDRPSACTAPVCRGTGHSGSRSRSASKSARESTRLN